MPQVLTYCPSGSLGAGVIGNVGAGVCCCEESVDAILRRGGEVGIDREGTVAEARAVRARWAATRRRRLWAAASMRRCGGRAREMKGPRGEIEPGKECRSTPGRLICISTRRELYAVCTKFALGRLTRCESTLDLQKSRADSCFPTQKAGDIIVPQIRRLLHQQTREEQGQRLAVSADGPKRTR